MPEDRPATRARILAAARFLMNHGGPGAVTFDAIAARIGLSKQAVLYWFPTKAALLAAVALPMLRDEAEAAIAAAETAPTPAEARRRVVLALVGFHLADLSRFRLIYAAPQLGSGPGPIPGMVEAIHPITDAMYAAIARALGDGPEARAQAVALHMAALGHVTLVGVTEAAGDPLKLPPLALAETLAAMLAWGR